MTLNLPLWSEYLIGALLLASGLFVLLAGIGLVRLQTFFQRMHPPALLTTGAAWCMTLASIVFFTLARNNLSLKSWLIIILLAITVPIATVLLARAALFRARQSGDSSLPPPLRTPR